LRQAEAAMRLMPDSHNPPWEIRKDCRIGA
jgi:hypothetical protein